MFHYSQPWAMITDGQILLSTTYYQQFIHYYQLINGHLHIMV